MHLPARRMALACVKANLKKKTLFKSCFDDIKNFNSCGKYFVSQKPEPCDVQVDVSRPDLYKTSKNFKPQHRRTVSIPLLKW